MGYTKYYNNSEIKQLVDRIPEAQRRHLKNILNQITPQSEKSDLHKYVLEFVKNVDAVYNEKSSDDVIVSANSLLFSMSNYEYSPSKVVIPELNKICESYKKIFDEVKWIEINKTVKQVVEL